jgi:hypothetical protein
MTSNTTISSVHRHALSVVAPWAGEQVKAVSPPKRCVKCCGPPRFSASKLGRYCHGGAAVSQPNASQDPSRQNRSIRNIKSSATVTAAEISKDPRQPSRFEKKKNMVCYGPDYLAHVLVAEDVAALHGRVVSVEEVKVRAADRTRGDLDDRVARVADLRIRNRLPERRLFRASIACAWFVSSKMPAPTGEIAKRSSGRTGGMFSLA